MLNHLNQADSFGREMVILGTPTFMKVVSELWRQVGVVVITLSLDSVHH